MKRVNQKGFSVVEVLVIVLVISSIVCLAYYIWSRHSNNSRAGIESQNKVTSSQKSANDVPDLYLPKNYSGKFKVKGGVLLPASYSSSPQYLLTVTVDSPASYQGQIVFHPAIYTNTTELFNPPTDCGNGTAEYLSEKHKATPCEFYAETKAGIKIYAYMYHEVGDGPETRVFYALIEKSILFIPVFHPQASKEEILEFINSFTSATKSDLDEYVAN